jgi:hypothetical protein
MVYNSLSALNLESQLIEVNKMLNTANIDTHITFWGTRVVELTDQAGNKISASLSLLVRKTLDAARKRCEADDLTPAERIAGVEIVRKLQNFYKMTDAQVKECNFITRFFIWIREFSFVPYTPRFYLNETAEDNFLAYSEKRFVKEITPEKKDEYEYAHSRGSFGPPL